VEQFQHSVSKTSKKLIKKLNKVKPSILISLGIFIFLVGASNYYNDRILSFTKTPQEAKVVLKEELPVEIDIPSIGISLPIDVGAIKDGVWQISYNHPTFLDTSAAPGSGGNTVIYGHNKNNIFGPIRSDGKTYYYKVIKTDTVNPDNLEYVMPKNEEVLTIYTCTGFLDSKRFMVIAKRV
jgi:LPXTG-site transpeptidase (sortase) family protein